MRSGNVSRLREFVGTQRGGDLLEHAVDEAVPFGAAEALAELDCTVRPHLEGRPGRGQRPLAADVENGTPARRKPVERAIEVRRDHRLQLGAALEHPAHDVLGELLIGALVAVERLHLLERIAVRELPGVKRLQSHFPRLPLCHFHCSPAFSLAISTATRTASAPLSRRALACASSSVVRIPLATGRPHSSEASITPRADSFATISKW